jgi:hypothetical protein
MGVSVLAELYRMLRAKRLVGLCRLLCSAASAVSAM